jgi:hypothetical protein
MLLPNNDFNAPENNGCLVPLAPNPGYCGARNIRIRSDFVISVRRLRTDDNFTSRFIQTKFLTFIVIEKI